MVTRNDNDGLRRLIRSRIAEYSEHDIEAERARLVEMWRKVHPEAASEPPSAKYRPLMLYEKRPPDVSPDRAPDEIWVNDVYQVTLRRVPDRMFGTSQGMVQLGISTHSGTARHDWREFQGIKNQLAGEECEAVELYPAESRLMDPSNYYSLWCFPGIRRLKIGHDEPRRVYEAHEAFAPQRGFEP